MLDSKGFNAKLKTIATNVTQMRENLQQCALYVIHQNCSANTNPGKELLLCLTKEGKDGREYLTADASRVMTFISDFSPVVVRPAKGEMKYSKARADKGMVWRGEEEYPNWYDYTHHNTQTEIKEKDGFALLLSMTKRLIDRVKEGSLKLTPESRPAFERILNEIDTIIKSEAESTAKAISAQKEQEQNQKAASRGKVVKQHDVVMHA